MEIWRVCEGVQVVPGGTPDEFYPLTRGTLFPAGQP